MKLWKVAEITFTTHYAAPLYPYHVIGTYTDACGEQLAGKEFSWSVPAQSLEDESFDLSQVVFDARKLGTTEAR